eukprot:Gb_10619 [translate_table: standard]
MTGVEEQSRRLRGEGRDAATVRDTAANVYNPRYSKSSAKRPAVENGVKAPSVPSFQQAKKRAALANLSNQRNIIANVKDADCPVSSFKPQGLVEPTTSKVKTTASLSSKDANTQQQSVSKTFGSKQPVLQAPIDQSLLRNNEPCNGFVSFHTRSGNLSPNRSDGKSESMDESMSTSDSSKSPDVEYIGDSNDAAVASLERRTVQNLYISNHSHLKSRQVVFNFNACLPMYLTLIKISFAFSNHEATFVCHLFQESSSAKAKSNGLQIIDVDTNHADPQMCTVYAPDIDRHLRNAETKKRPAADYMEVVQEDINANMRGILIDWLVEVAEEYKLVPDTLYLTVSFIDRYLSKNLVNRQRLQLLGVTCMLIAAKYEEICAPQVEEFCYITDNTYFRDEVLQMESNILKHLHFELSTPTVKSFLRLLAHTNVCLYQTAYKRRFVRAAQVCPEVQFLQLEFLANYLAELTLPEYSFLGYLPSLVAASAVFLAKVTLDPTTRPWNATLKHYTQYRPSELRNCVKALHELQCDRQGCSLPAIREKYRQHKFKCASTLIPPSVIPLEFFFDFDC